MSRLTFQIKQNAIFRGATPPSPMASLRARLFGIKTRRGRAPGVQAVTSSAPRNFGQDRNAVVRRLPWTWPPLAMYPEPFRSIPPPPAMPTKIAAVKAAPAPIPAPISVGQGLTTTRYQVEYKGRLISASQIEDGNWIATHVSVGDEPSDAHVPPEQNVHSFIARILAIASAEIEIDDLEQARLIVGVPH
jgi:hypothetical protein